MAKKQRTDAERRLRQSERLSRLLRTLHLLSGPGRWNIDSLAEELECSRRTIYRDLQTLSMAGVPWFLDTTSQSYRIREGFKFPNLDRLCNSLQSRSKYDLIKLNKVANQLRLDAEKFIHSLSEFCTTLNGSNLDEP